MTARFQLIWRWLRYQIRRFTPDVMDTTAQTRRRIRGRRSHIERVVARIGR